MRKTVCQISFCLGKKEIEEENKNFTAEVLFINFYTGQLRLIFSKNTKTLLIEY